MITDNTKWSADCFHAVIVVLAKRPCWTGGRTGKKGWRGGGQHTTFGRLIQLQFVQERMRGSPIYHSSEPFHWQADAFTHILESETHPCRPSMEARREWNPFNIPSQDDPGVDPKMSIIYQLSGSCVLWCDCVAVFRRNRRKHAPPKTHERRTVFVTHLSPALISLFALMQITVFDYFLIKWRLLLDLSTLYSFSIKLWVEQDRATALITHSDAHRKRYIGFE